MKARRLREQARAVADREGIDVDNPNDVMPFVRKPGRLLVAPLTSAFPWNVVKDGAFIDEWDMAAWVLVGSTDPKESRASSETSTDSIEVAPGRLVPLVTARQERWVFGVDSVPVEPHVSLADLGHHVFAQPRVMVGWESEDRTSRALVRQAVRVDEGFRNYADRAVLPVAFSLEAARVPAQAAPKVRWWQRLLRRVLRRRPQVTPPEFYPPFTVYEVGELRKSEPVS